MVQKTTKRGRLCSAQGGRRPGNRPLDGALAAQIEARHGSESDGGPRSLSSGRPSAGPVGLQ